MLEVRDLRVDYGRIAAVQGVSLSVAAGEIVAVIGANGAGKSSILNAVAGTVRPSAGSIRFKGEAMTGHAAHRHIQRGIVQVPEGRMIFRTLTVLENLQVGAYRLGSLLLGHASPDDVLQQFPMLAGRLHEPASNLSGGQAQMLAVARGLMAKPSLLLLDEPTLGLSPIAAEDVFNLVCTLRSEGLTILIVEQNVRRTLAIADRGYVVEGGRIVLHGPAEELKSDDRLVAGYLGVNAGRLRKPMEERSQR
ncbi:MAG: ABC transporter ATP-binding protein [Boseongicola sp.]|nr:ABC transporter ATP-binding protein [Boseongicola sp.]MXW86628.1 ABC transporter ATP-binding protein [Boseongicola sp. SB0667_bin_21]MYI69194.1 ABC transporter ATP-binding protein [Boseongicola sp. SB0673_bin_14]